MHRTIRKLLIANRGEIARRVMRTCREMGIATVAVYSDADASALHAREADEGVRLPGASVAATYLNSDALVVAAQRAGADAVHPGYGFLSENAAFAGACADAGLVFVGPTPEVIAQMGSKREARRLMAAAGVPVVPGYDGAEQSDELLLSEAERIGYPVMLKASAGGGGKGMRIIAEPGEALTAFAAARREALAAFGDATLLLEKAISEPRHIEFQIFGDQHGALVHLGERECSIQRRHQKIIEESPAPGLTPTLRKHMAASALTVGRTLSYTNAGTVEFIVGPDGAYYFLEVNTRLQVEHPVTEHVTGLDLVRWQIMVAEGQPLPLTQEKIISSGHAIEARLYAEDPDAGFLPSTGQIAVWRGPENARCDAGIQSGDDMAAEYDPLIAKISAHAATRAEAARRLASAMERTIALGVRTNGAFLARTLRHPAYLAGDTTTSFIARHHDELFATSEPEPGEPSAMGLAALLAALARRSQSVTPTQRYWRNSLTRPIIERFEPLAAARSGQANSVTVSLEPQRDGRYMASIVESGDMPGDGWQGAVCARERQPDGRITAEVNGRLVEGWLAERDGVWWVHVAGETRELSWRSPLPEPDAVAATSGSLVAPMPGVVVALLVEIGQVVRVGEPLVTLEAMKMEHTIRAPWSGVVTAARYRERDKVAAGAVLLDIERQSESER